MLCVREGCPALAGERPELNNVSRAAAKKNCKNMPGY